MHIARIHSMEECLTEWAKAEIDKGKECVCTKEMGDVVDMIKDLAKAEKDAYEAKYYKQIVEAMEDYKEKEKCNSGTPWYLSFLNDRAGYDNWRYSSGRFAPKGHGHYAGYMPTEWREPYMNEADWDNTWPENFRMGYDEGMKRGTGMPASTRMGYGDGMSEKGMHYDRYKEARRHYTETHSEKDKNEMNEHAKKHLESSIESFRDMWNNSDPEMKRKMKANLSGLVNEMNV